MRILMFFAMSSNRTVRKTEVADRCNASESHVAVVIHQLGLAGYLKTLRGRGGRIRLNAAPADIYVGAVFREFEHKYPFAECFDQTGNTCPLIQHCSLKPLIGEALGAFYDVLYKASLSDLVTGNSGLAKVLNLPPVNTRSARRR